MAKKTTYTMQDLVSAMQGRDRIRQSLELISFAFEDFIKGTNSWLSIYGWGKHSGRKLLKLELETVNEECKPEKGTLTVKLSSSQESRIEMELVCNDRRCAFPLWYEKGKAASSFPECFIVPFAEALPKLLSALAEVCPEVIQHKMIFYQKQRGLMKN
ncbi:MAG TPA: hypothetical protein VJG48_03250 [Candidatus Paceibacterota bacterium]